MTTQNIKNALMRVLYNIIVAADKGLVWTIRLVTGQTAREANAETTYHADRQAQATEARDEAIADLKTVCIGLDFAGDEATMAVVAANDTKTVLTVVDGGSK